MQKTDPVSAESVEQDEDAGTQKAIEADPLLLGDRERAIPPDDLFVRMKPPGDPVDRE
ncbi:MAG TPA: hypothetical protein VF895_02695 [Gaiellaceae bacterium]